MDLEHLRARRIILNSVLKNDLNTVTLAADRFCNAKVHKNLRACFRYSQPVTLKPPMTCSVAVLKPSGAIVDINVQNPAGNDHSIDHREEHSDWTHLRYVSLEIQIFAIR